MKKLYVFLLLFSNLVVKEIYTQDFTQKNLSIKPSNFGTFGNNPEKEFIKQHLSQYSRYVNQNASTFEKNEQALLFGIIRYNFDTDLELFDFHRNPYGYLIEKLAESNNKLKGCRELLSEAFWDKSHRKKFSRYYLFASKMLSLAQKYAYHYQYLPLKEKDKAASYDYYVNGISHDRPGEKIFKDVENMQKSLLYVGISKTRDKVFEDVKTMFKRFRDESATKKEPERKSKFFGDTYETHEFLYAQLILEYVSFAAELNEEK